MAKRVSTEAKFLNWIDTAPVEVVQSIMGIAVARMKARVRGTEVVSVAPKQRKARRKKTDAQAMPGVLVAGAAS